MKTKYIFRNLISPYVIFQTKIVQCEQYFFLKTCRRGIKQNSQKEKLRGMEKSCYREQVTKL